SPRPPATWSPAPCARPRASCPPPRWAGAPASPGSPPAATWSTCAPTAAPSCGCATGRPAARSTAIAGPADPGRRPDGDTRAAVPTAAAMILTVAGARCEAVGYAVLRPESPTADRPHHAHHNPPLRPGRRGSGAQPRHSPDLEINGIVAPPAAVTATSSRIAGGAGPAAAGCPGRTPACPAVSESRATSGSSETRGARRIRTGAAIRDARYTGCGRKTAGRSSLRLEGSGYDADVRRTGGGGRGGPGRGLGVLVAGRPGGGGAAARGVPAADERAAGRGAGRGGHADRRRRGAGRRRAAAAGHGRHRGVAAQRRRGDPAAAPAGRRG